jgi:soluble lytic murein transglycosylase
MRAGKLLEGLDRTNDALAAYARLAKDYPSHSLAAQAQLRIGLLSVFRGRPADGAPSLAALAQSDASSGMRAWALMWLGKIEASGGNAEAARGRWQAAVQTSPLTFGGFRSAGLLNGDQGAVAGSSGLDLGKVGVSAQELADLDAWLAAKGVNRQALSDQLAADPALARADDLLAMGQAELAAWEWDDLARRGPEAERQYVLSLAMADRGLARLAMTQVLDGLRKGGVASADAPRALQKLLYPLPYAPQLAARGAQYGADPLLLAALIRQESSFNPRARSRANALGLAQVIPSTGAGIARSLGRPGFQESDLFRPDVGIEFGAYYLSQALSRRGGQVFPALAGYNAGNGAVDGWLRDPANADADVFSERIPYPETDNYVHIVFENYGMYRALYSK